jgi:hypothetical protein
VPIPPSAKLPIFTVRSPAPAVSATATVIRLRASEKSTRFSTQMRPAVAAMRPKTTSASPPITGPGKVKIKAPNFGEKPSRSATQPATTKTRVEKTRVTAITPMFSA